MGKLGGSRPGAYLLSALLSSAAFITPVAAAAQAVSNDVAPTNGSMVSEVIVTAQKRAEKLVDVPISVSVFNEKQLERVGAVEARDLNLITPSLNYQVQGAFAQPTIRGVGTTSTIGESNVAIYVDGVYQTAQAGNVLGLTNIRQIEVLKGPQGTLFGRNASGGAILVTTTDPSYDTNGNGSISYGTFNTSKLAAYVNAALVPDRVAVNLALTAEDTDGYTRNVFLKKDEAFQNERSARLKILVNPLENLRLILTGSYRQRGDSLGITFKPLNYNLALVHVAPELVTPGSPYEIPSDPFEVSTDTIPTQTIDDRSLSLRATYSGEWGTINSITAVRRFRLDSFSDADFTSLPDTAFGRALAASVRRGTNDFVQEINFASPGDGRFSWVGGVFFLHKRDRVNIALYRGFGGSTLAATLTNNVASRTTASAIYGEANYNITDRLRLTGGLRYSTETAHTLGTSHTWPSVTPRVSLRYSLTDHSNAYFTYSKGFKSGEFNTASGLTTPINQEKLNAYEVGYKLSTPGLVFNAAAYYYDYTDLQVQRYNGLGVVTASNAEKATIYGIDADVQAHLGENFTVSAGAAWTHARYDDFSGAPFFTPIPGGGNTQTPGNAADKEIARTPEIMANVTGAYDHDLPLGSLETSVTVSYNGGFYWNPSNSMKQDAYTIVNGRLAWTLPDERYVLSLWGRNLTDEVYQIYGNPTAGGDVVAYGSPRTIGVALDFNF